MEKDVLPSFDLCLAAVADAGVAGDRELMGEVPSEAAGDVLESDSCCCWCGSAGVRKRPTSILSSSLVPAEDGNSAAGGRRWESCKVRTYLTKRSLQKC